MFEKILDDSIEMIIDKIKNCNDTEIQNQLNVIYGRLPDEISKKDFLDDVAAAVELVIERQVNNRIV